VSQGATADPADDGQDLMAPGVAAQLLGVHRSTLGRWASADPPLIESVLLRSGHRRYPRAEVYAIRNAGTGAAR
jgi:predicted site-specific integrase-resolvase